MSKKIDIEMLLKERMRLIDKVIEKYIPRKIGKSSVDFMCGKIRYRYSIEAIQKTISEPVWDLLGRGGKRWRPMLFLLVYEALGRKPDDVLEFAIIPEVIHNGTLIIDDIEDSSELRRGKPCTYKIFGSDVAINVGNAMYYLPLLTLIKNKDKFDSETLVKVYETYVQEMVNLSFGQAMDIAWHRGMVNANELTEEEYLQMCAFKTGTLARMAAKIAAILAKADKQQVEAFGKFAETIGIAFQIQDDILNLTGKEFTKGKGFGEDITEGKRSLPIIYTLRKATLSDKASLIKILNSHTKDRKTILKAISIIKRYGSIEYAKELGSKMVKEAWDEIDKFLKPSDAKNKLKAFADYLVERKI